MDTQTDYAVAPGEWVHEWLEDNEISQAELARRMGVSGKHVSKLLTGATITPDVALKLEMVTGTPTRRWLQLEALYRADLARLGAQEEFARHDDLLDELKDAASYLRRQGVVTVDRRRPGVLLMQIMQFFGVASIDAFRETLKSTAAAFRQSGAHRINQASVATWLRMAEVRSRELQLADYNANQLRNSLDSIKSISTRNPNSWGVDLTNRLSSLGVGIIYEPEVTGSRAYGATMWRPNPIIVMSLRGKSDSDFWFTLFHELGHVLLHPQQTTIEFKDGSQENEAETQADDFASEILIPQSERATIDSLRTKAQVISEASRLGVCAGIVVGHLHHNRIWPYERGAGLKTRLQFSE